MLVLFGGTGFIGRHICAFAQANQIPTIVISRQPSSKFPSKSVSGVSYVQSGSAESLKALSEAKTIVFLASNSKPATGKENLAKAMLETANVLMSFVETLFLINPTCHLIYLSSGGQIYGPNHTHPIEESIPTNPSTPYALSKSNAESFLTYITNTQSARISILRLANPVGQWQLGTSHGLVSHAINAAISGSPLTIFGDGKNMRDYFDVDEFATFICRLHRLDNTESGIFNIGTSIGYGENDIVNIVQGTLGLKIDLNYAEAREYDLRYSVLNIDKAKAILRWSPKISIADSIQKISDAIVEKKEA